MKPTEEQLKALELFRTGESLKINAFAGAGKTTTLSLLAQDTPKKGLYLAFNKSIANDASEKFPSTVSCSTIHSLAYRAIIPHYNSDKLTKSVNANALAQQLQLGTWKKDEFSLNARSQGFLILETVKKFTQGVGKEPSTKDVPRHGKLANASQEIVDEVAALTAARAKVVWERMIDPSNPLPMGHDGYLKLWAQSNPRLLGDFILLDEAQDSNPVILDVLSKQKAQIIYVGDRYQQIYEWRGAVNAMETIETSHTAYLTKSFRFGNGIANAASKVLERLGETHSIQGNDKLKSFFDADQYDAILTRTNGCAIAETLEALSQGLQPHIVGGTNEMIRLLEGVEALKANTPCDLPEFFGFTSWHEIVELVKSGEGEQLKTFVNLVEKHGEVKLKQALRRTAANESNANIIISTAHKAKGREWRSVKLANDFFKSAPADGDKLPESEVRLFYVAITRGKEAIQIPSQLMEMFGIKKTPGTLRSHKPVEDSSLEDNYSSPGSFTPAYQSSNSMEYRSEVSSPPSVTMTFFGIPWYWWAIMGFVIVLMMN